MTYLVNRKKSAAFSAAIFLFALQLPQTLHSKEQLRIKPNDIKREAKEMNILCQNVGNSIHLVIINQDDNYHTINLTSKTSNQFTTSIDKNSQVNLSLSKEQFPIKIITSSSNKTTVFMIDKDCKISS
ncbi:hypothetical protein FR932_10220 [Moritella marina ATCC 15381]|uniref:Uncharacterized protein n=1 Tax=Moritella marina ATCC 15381 TaxID=1202962 RepID=A0A5J6WL83_MORMI|nr:hypothetical protein [Moritella marina]QFI38194.1 hypothetical protein FR932_10220 [Moritella marina ATCC 15381]